MWRESSFNKLLVTLQFLMKGAQVKILPHFVNKKPSQSMHTSGKSLGLTEDNALSPEFAEEASEAVGI